MLCCSLLHVKIILALAGIIAFVQKFNISSINGGMAMGKNSIEFKGTKEGVIVTVNGQSDCQQVKETIGRRLDRSRDFFKNGKIYIDFGNSGIDELQQREIKEFLFDNYGVSIQDIERNKVKVFNGIYEGRTKFVRNTVRSGQLIEYPGNVVVIGDVNAGGQIKAGGNVVILGTLRGVVHAGSSGNDRAIVAAFSLQPTQLRISGIIARSPDDEPQKPDCPELARIKDGQIVIEPYAPNKVSLSLKRVLRPSEF